MLSLEYIAGLFDGEGTIYLGDRQHSSRGYLLQIIVTNTYSEVLYDVASRLGGKVTKRSRLTSGGKEAFDWKVTGLAAQDILSTLLPYLQIKHEEAEVAIRFPISLPGERIWEQTTIDKRAAIYQEFQKIRWRKGKLAMS